MNEIFKEARPTKKDKEAAATCPFCQYGDKSGIERVATKVLKNYLSMKDRKKDDGYTTVSVEYACVCGKEDCAVLQTYRMAKELKKRMKD